MIISIHPFPPYSARFHKPRSLPPRYHFLHCYPLPVQSTPSSLPSASFPAPFSPYATMSPVPHPRRSHRTLLLYPHHHVQVWSLLRGLPLSAGRRIPASVGA